MRTEVHILGHHYIVKVHGQECLLPIILRPLWVDSDFLGYHISDIYADFITIAQRVLPITLLLLVFIATSTSSNRPNFHQQSNTPSLPHHNPKPTQTLFFPTPACSSPTPQANAAAPKAVNATFP